MSGEQIAVSGDDFTNDEDGLEEGEPKARPQADRDAIQMPANVKRMVRLSTSCSMEVPVEDNIERAIKVLKRKLIKEGLFKELKARRYFEKPSERKKRKVKESVKKIRKDAARAKKNPHLF